MHRPVIEHAQVGAVRIGWRSLGEGAPLVLLVGLRGTQDQWPRAMLEALARDRRLILMDHRGIGASSDAPGPYGIEDLADDVAGLLDAIGVDRADVLGWSMGGAVAAELAFRHPARVGRLVLCAATPGRSHGVAPDPAVLAAVTDDSGTGADRGLRMLNVLVPPAWLAKHPRFIGDFPRPRGASDPERVARQAAAFARWDAWERWPSLDKPVLVVHGLEDVLAVPENGRRLAGRIPGAWLVQWRGGGHALMHQFPEGFARVVRVFLETAQAGEGG